MCIDRRHGTRTRSSRLQTATPTCPAMIGNTWVPMGISAILYVRREPSIKSRNAGCRSCHSMANEETLRLPLKRSVSPCSFMNSWGQSSYSIKDALSWSRQRRYVSKQVIPVSCSSAFMTFPMILPYALFIRRAPAPRGISPCIPPWNSLRRFSLAECTTILCNIPPSRRKINPGGHFFKGIFTIQPPSFRFPLVRHIASYRSPASSGGSGRNGPTCECRSRFRFQDSKRRRLLIFSPRFGLYVVGHGFFRSGREFFMSEPTQVEDEGILPGAAGFQKTQTA